MAIKFLEEEDVIISGDIPLAAADVYAENFLKLTKGTGRLLLFVCDQKIEHLNDAFVGKNISLDSADPEHMFKIADKAVIGAMAAQIGLIARYGHKYPNIPYLVKLNSKTKVSDYDNAGMLGTIEQVSIMRRSGVNILGVGYTLYLGGDNEYRFLEEAANVVALAHQKGLVAVLWVIDDKEDDRKVLDAHRLAGNAGVALALGYDFVHLYGYVNDDRRQTAEEKFSEVIKAAGNIGVSVRAGKIDKVDNYISLLHKQINLAKTSGVGIGRAIHQKDFLKAVKLLNTTSSIVLANESIKTAKRVYDYNKLSAGLKQIIEKEKIGFIND